MALLSLLSPKTKIGLALLLIAVTMLFFAYNTTTLNGNRGMSYKLDLAVTRGQPENKKKMIRSLGFNWLIKGSNILPNYFTRPYDDITSTRQPPDDVYANSTIVFIHNQKSGGSTIKNCLRRIMKIPSQPIYFDNVKSFYTNIIDGGSHQNLARAYLGGYTFGVCDFTSKPCSYFTVVRDPFERMLSAYNQCTMQKNCGTGSFGSSKRESKDFSLKEYALYMGSWAFDQFIANQRFFTPQYEDMTRNLTSYYDIDADGIAPLKVNQLILDNLMSREAKTVVLDYVLSQLESWFAVIGLTEEYELNMPLFEYVYKLPFATNCSSVHGNGRKYIAFDSELKTGSSKEDLVEELHDELASDDDVMDALYYDIQLYRKFQDIFRRQVAAYERDSRK